MDQMVPTSFADRMREASGEPIMGYFTTCDLSPIAVKTDGNPCCGRHTNARLQYRSTRHVCARVDETGQAGPGNQRDRGDADFRVGVRGRSRIRGVLPKSYGWRGDIGRCPAAPDSNDNGQTRHASAVRARVRSRCHQIADSRCVSRSRPVLGQDDLDATGDELIPNIARQAGVRDEDVDRGKGTDKG